MTYKGYTIQNLYKTVQSRCIGKDLAGDFSQYMYKNVKYRL